MIEDSVYSMIDPSQPETYGYPLLRPITLSVTSASPACAGTVSGTTVSGTVTVTSGTLVCQ